MCSIILLHDIILKTEINLEDQKIIWISYMNTVTNGSFYKLHFLSTSPRVPVYLAYLIALKRRKLHIIKAIGSLWPSFVGLSLQQRDVLFSHKEIYISFLPVVATRRSISGSITCYY